MPIFTPVHTSVFAAARDWEAYLLHRDTLATGYRCLLRLSDHTPGHYLYRIDEGTPRPAWYPAFQTADASGTIAWAGLTLNYKWFRFDSDGAWARWTCPADATGSNRIQLYVYGTGTGNTFDVIKNLGQPGQQTVYSGEADTGDLEALREITLASPLAEGDTIAIVQTGGSPRIHSFFTYADNVALSSVDQPYTIDGAVTISAPGSSMEYAQDLNPGAGGKWTGGLSHQENATGNCTEINLVSTWLRDGAPWTPEAGWHDGEFRRNVTADIDYDLTPTVIATTDYTYTLGKRLLEFSHTLEATTALTVITNYVAMFPCDPAWPSAARSNTGEIIDLLGTGNPVEFDDPIGINRVTISTTPAGRHVQFDLQSNSGRIDNVFFSRLVDNKKCYYRQALEIVTATEQWHGGWSLAFTDGTPAPDQEAIVRGRLMPVDVGRKTWVQDRTSGQDWVWQGDGIGRYIELEASPVRQFRERTIWLKVKTTSAGIEYFYSSASSQNANAQLAIGQDAAGNALVRAVAGNATQNEIVGPAINDGQWHQLIGQLNRNGHVWLWVDGVLAGSDETDPLPETEFDTFSIGALVHQGADDYSAAAICQAGIVNRLSGGAEIAEIAAGRYPADALNFPIDNGPAMLTAAVNIPASYWLDKSAQQNHAYGDNDARPMIRRDAFGNHYLAGDGSNDTLQTLRALVARTGGNLSVFLVYESRSASANLIEESTGITGAPGPQGFLLNTAVNTTRINGSAGYWSGTVPAAPVGAKAIREVHSSDGQQIVLDDGVEVGTPGAVAIGAMGGDILNLFSRDGSANFLDGDIYRIYAYPVRLTAEEADAVRAWIQAAENMGPQPPVLGGIEIEAIEYTFGTVSVTDSLTVLSESDLESATIQFPANYVDGEDRLLATATPNITSEWTPGTLTLTGTADAAEYQTALRSVAYINQAEIHTENERIVSFTTTNAIGVSNQQTRSINVLPKAITWNPSDEQSCVAWWRADEGLEGTGGGDSVEDTSGNGNTAAFFNFTQPEIDAFFVSDTMTGQGTSGLFPGSDRALQPTVPISAGTGEWTILWKAKGWSLPPGSNGTFWFGHSTQTAKLGVWNTAGNEESFFRVLNGGAAERGLDFNGLSASWNTFALTRDAGNVVELRLNNGAPQTLFGGSPQVGETLYDRIGNVVTDGIDGLMDDVRVYTRKLTEQEMTDWFNGTPPASTGAVVIYTMDFSADLIDGGEIGSWIDSIGGFELTPDNGGPTYRQTQLSGNPSADFNGTDNNLSGVLADIDGRTVMLNMVTGDTVAGIQTLIAKGVAGSDDTYDELRINGDRLELVHATTGSAEVIEQGVVVFAPNTAYTLWVGSDGVVAYTFNGTVIEIMPIPWAGWLPISASDYISIGARKSDQTGSPLVDQYAKVLITDLAIFTEVLI